MNVKERIKNLREKMIQEGVDVYYIPTSDFHQSEYISDYFKVREFMSGFTGSAGTLVITLTEAALFVDGRYFTQADRELKNSGIRAMKMGQQKVPTVMEYLKENLPEKGVLGFDGRAVSSATATRIQTVLQEKMVTFKTDKDLVDSLWVDRPQFPKGECFLLPDKYTGEKTEKKIARLREEMKKEGSEAYLLSALEDVAWLLNLRGRDIKHTPVTLAYVLVTNKKVVLYVDKKKISEVVNKRLKKAKVMIRPYEAIQSELGKITEKTIHIDSQSLNVLLRLSIINSCKIIDKPSVIRVYRALKNKTELKSIKNSHIKDGVAVTKFIYWIKNNVGKIEINELSAAKKLEELRAEQELFIEPSFSTIAAVGANAAMMHYSATESSFSELKKEGLFLVDSGGQYFDGTTDITRTIVLGNLSKEARTYYTAVLRGMICLSKAKFLHGVSGSDLDILARGPIWNMDLDYQCGTGHGIGFCLGVHEGPQSIRWGVRGKVSLEEGMVVTNEPGVYLPQELGIRIENELLVCKGKKNKYGQFLNFETITLAPIDLDGVNPEEMMDDELDFLNEYHQEVYKKLSPHLTKKEKTWLKIQTRKIQK